MYTNATPPKPRRSKAIPLCRFGRRPGLSSVWSIQKWPPRWGSRTGTLRLGQVYLAVGKLSNGCISCEATGCQQAVFRTLRCANTRKLVQGHACGKNPSHFQEDALMSSSAKFSYRTSFESGAINLVPQNKTASAVGTSSQSLPSKETKEGKAL